MKYLQKIRLEIHERTHTGKNPFKCPFELCNKTFNEKGNLKIHLRNHVDSKPYKCLLPNCGQAYKFPYLIKNHSLNAHNLSGTGFECFICNQIFNRYKTLTIHIKIHSEFDFKNGNTTEFDSLLDNKNILTENIEVFKTKKLNKYSYLKSPSTTENEKSILNHNKNDSNSCLPLLENIKENKFSNKTSGIHYYSKINNIDLEKNIPSTPDIIRNDYFTELFTSKHLNINNIQTESNFQTNKININDPLIKRKIMNIPLLNFSIDFTLDPIISNTANDSRNNVICKSASNISYNNNNNDIMDNNKKDNNINKSNNIVYKFFNHLHENDKTKNSNFKANKLEAMEKLKAFTSLLNNNLDEIKLYLKNIKY